MVSGSDPIGKSFPDLPHTSANAQLHNAVYGASQSEGGKKVHPGPGDKFLQIHYAIARP